MFENKVINGIHATRYIMSWVHEGGKLGVSYRSNDNFRRWLLSLGLTEDESKYIVHLANNGKLELEYSANKFLESMTTEQ